MAQERVATLARQIVDAPEEQRGKVHGVIKEFNTSNDVSLSFGGTRSFGRIINPLLENDIKGKRLITAASHELAVAGRKRRQVRS